MKERHRDGRQQKNYPAPEAATERLRTAMSREGKSIETLATGEDRTLTSVLQSLSDGITVVDREGEIIFANQAAQEITGLADQGVSPDQWSATYGCYLSDKVTPYPPEQLPLYRAMQGEQVTDAEIYIRHAQNPAGTWISVNSSPLYDEAGALNGGVIVFRDMTAQKRSSEVARHLSKAVEHTADSVFITDAEGRIEYVNPAFEETTGYRREEVLGRRPSILKSGKHGRDYYDKLWATILAGNVHTGTVINQKKNGDLFHAEQTITPIKDSSGNLTHFVSLVKDVTELKRAKEREVEMRLARVVQQKLYPSEAPRLEGFDIAGATYPTAETCGDYFDYISMADDYLALAIGDVSGHGFGPALLMAETRAYLRSLVRLTSDLGEILYRLNQFLDADTEYGRYVTLILVRLDPRRRSFIYANAGHTPGYLLDSSGAVKRELGATGLPLGLFAGRGFTSCEEIPLAEGDLIVLLTDGVTESGDPEREFFTAQRALKLVAARRGHEARRIVEDLYAAVSEHTAPDPQVDDITAVVCKVLAVP